MRITWIFATLAVLLLLLCGVAFYYMGRNAGVTLYIAEGLLAAAIILIAIFYTRVNRPLHALSQGVDMLRGQEFNSRLRHVGQYEVDRVVDAFNPLIESLHRRSVELAEHNHLFNSVVENSPMGVVLTDPQGRVILRNQAAEKMPAAVTADVTPGNSKIVKITPQEIYRVSCDTFMRDGYPHYVYTIVLLTDEIAAAERRGYNSVIRLMAHEVNNTAGAVASTIEVIQDNPALIPDEQEALSASVESMQHLSSFVNRLAQVARLPEPQIRPGSLRDLLSNMRPVLESICSQHHAALSITLPDDDVIAPIDAPMLEQAIVNIVKNAAESPSTTLVTITLHALAQPVRAAALSGPWILEISDNGQGISPEQATHLFTPFFTTKPGGQGIGLTMVAHTLRGHHFHFALATEAQITTFTITP
ncbi:MAG: hypothetical protein LIP02_13130 [Bacteroidales bacterium]|nr:hypothetical protein [Bacteroidales bacterium]